ncbi:MAG: phosphoglycerate dehydrogenase [Bacillota bacterium]|nr:phosphoglycerate dehydrogenase [Bacillota bacterium]
MKILVAEKINQRGIDVLNGSGLEIVYDKEISREKLLSIIGEFDGLIVRSQPIVDKQLLEAATRLKVVGRAGNGVDNIDMEAATDRGIIVVNTPDSNSVSACELTIGLLISVCRNIPQANNSIKSGEWGRSRFQGHELSGKTLGIIGLGRIGNLVAKRMRAFDMDIIAYDPYITDERFRQANVRKAVSLEELLREVDYLTIHTPKTPETIGMVGAEQFAMMKDGVRVVNCARGGLYDEAALADALRSGKVAAAACDVLAKEPCLDSPLYELDNFIVTPHIGATTDEAQENVGITVADEVVNALKGEIVANAVNLPILKAEDVNVIKPYLRLGELLGKLYHQLQKKPIERVTVEYCGTVGELDTDVITRAVLRGLFEPILKEQINYVNARRVAEGRGVKVIESKEKPSGHFPSLVRVRVSAGERIYQYCGTIFGNDDPRIVEIDGFRFDFRPEPYMLVVENADRPGMIGRIGMVLGEQNINISAMQVCPSKRDDKLAMMTIGVSQKPTDEQMKAIESVSDIYKVRLVEF